jgi:C1A family cysteine protease
MTSQSLNVVSGRGKGLGYIPDFGDYRDHYLTLPMVTRLPKVIDLRDKMSPVYDQGQLGSCTGNAIAGAVQFSRMKQGLPDFIPSRLFIYYNERVIENSVSEDAGAMIRDGIKAVANWGVCPEPEWPYDVNKFADKPTEQAYKDAALNQAVKYARVRQGNSYMRSCLAHGWPFVVGFTVYDAFESDEVASTGVLNMPKPDESVLGGHAVLACGYDDNTKRYLMKNSWGTEWGQAGYFTMPYDYLANHDLATDLWNVQLCEV